ncbi:MAG: hypothetical protein ACFB4J_17440 [Elainellaceae cyanobacterium]
MSALQPARPSQRKSSRAKRPAARRRNRWFEKLMAAIALLNFVLVLFDYSYIPARDYYLRFFPEFTRWYGGKFKGIEPQRVTAAYLETVEDLEEQVVEGGISSAAVGRLLAELRTRSEAIVDENPFELADKTGALERIKDRIRERVSDATGGEFESSKEAFAAFWSQDYLSEQDYSEELSFFNTQIRPLFEANYYRSIDSPLLGLSGIPTDRFILIDIWFIGIFAAEFLARTWWLQRRYQDTSWLDTMMWRWYDLFLLIPFWRWLRAIPVISRINQSNLIDLEPVRNRLTRGIVANFAIELTEVVILRIIDQVQNLIREGDITRSLLNSDGSEYIDLNDIDEIKVIIDRIVSTLTYRVLPEVKPDVEAILYHNIQSVLKEAPLYSQLRSLPGVESTSERVAKQLVSELYDALYASLTGAMQDDVGAELTAKLIQDIGDSFRREIQQGSADEEIASLIAVWLDEVKVNYVKRLGEEDVEALREQTQKLYAITQKSS